MHPLDVATASAAAGVVARLVGTATSRVTAQLLRGELPRADGVDPAAVEELLRVIVRGGYLVGEPDDLTDATAALARACGLHASAGRRMLHRGLLVTAGDTRAFLRTGSHQVLLEEVARSSTADRHDLDVQLPWRPWEALDALARLLPIELPQWRHDTSSPTRERLWDVETDAATLTSAAATFYSDQSHAIVVQLGDLVARVAAIATELDGR